MPSQSDDRHNAAMKQLDSLSSPRQPRDAATALDVAGAALQRHLLRLRRQHRRRDYNQAPPEDQLGQALLETGLRIRRQV
jgi:hypothetical protein